MAVLVRGHERLRDEDSDVVGLNGGLKCGQPGVDVTHEFRRVEARSGREQGGQPLIAEALAARRLAVCNPICEEKQ